MQEVSCPRCGAARSSAATFCMICGQDLRPGAPVTPVPPPAPPAVGKRRGGSAAASPSEEPGPGFRVIRRPSRPGRPVPKTPDATSTARPPEATTATPKADPNLSFSERYHGTSLSPDVEALLPPGPAAVGGGRRRLAVVGIVVVALVLATAAGAFAFLFAPSAGDEPPLGSATAGANATATPTPIATPTPTPITTIHGLVPDEVEIAGCIVAAEMTAERTDLTTLLADIAAGRSAGVSDRARALLARLAQTADSAAQMGSFAPAKLLVVAYGQLLALESDALRQMADAADDPSRLAAAAKGLEGLDGATAVVAAAQVELLASFPEMACGSAP